MASVRRRALFGPGVDEIFGTDIEASEVGIPYASFVSYYLIYAKSLEQVVRAFESQENGMIKWRE